MTHAESQELLVDLAFGELPPERAAAAEAHIAGCAECQRDRAQLSEARAMTRDTRVSEEPSPGFDGPILAAARAQAQLEHDGVIGQVIEVKGSVQPLQMQAAAVNAGATVKPAAQRRKPHWALRAAIAASAAGGLALVLFTATRAPQRQAQQRPADYEIRVDEASRRALEKAEAKREAPAPSAPAASAPSSEAAPAAPPPLAAAPSAPRAVPPPPPPQTVARKAPPPRPSPPREEGSGGDVGIGARGAVQTKAELTPSADATTQAAEAPAPSPPRVASAREATNPGMAAFAARSPNETSAGAPAEPAPAALETRAEDARRQGNYALAAALYRKAAAAGAPHAAWDLAHAVECLAAAGEFDQAREVQTQLAQTFPGETSALTAARRATQRADLPGR